MLEVRNVSKEYALAAGNLAVLSGINLSLVEGDSAAVVGPSGSGKSTLLYMLGALEPPSTGVVRLGGCNPFQLDEKSLAKFRNSRIGFVFQDHHLLPQCTALENVLIPTLVAREADPRWMSRAVELLQRVGLQGRMDHRPHQLSGGEKQRVALVRALIMQPQLILCDEPTGNLDSDSADAVADLLLELHRSQAGILIVVTHNPDLASRFPSTYRLVRGRTGATLVASTQC